MKKLLTMAVFALSFAVTPAFAEGDGGGHKGGKMFEKQDTNGDGVISKSEFLAHAEEKFSKIDADGNGEITKEEGKSARKAMKGKMKDRIKARKEKRDGDSE